VHPLPIDRLSALVRRERCCVFLDNARPSREQRYSFLFTRPLKVIRCSILRDVKPALERLSQEARSGWIAGYLAYEAAYGLEERMAEGIDPSKRFPIDLLWFGVHEEPYRFDHLTGLWNREPFGGEKEEGRARELKAGPEATLRFGVSRTDYGRSIRAIKNLIAAGDVYQMNYTFGVAVTSRLRPWDLYRALRQMQPVPFGAFIKTARTSIASFSPELFFMRTGRRIAVRPMKGTAPRGRYVLEDEAIARTLSHDPKNRSENVMIVDLLRNDLGRICKTGSVRVDRLFEVERHPTLHQMTSTVSGRLIKGIGFSGILGALFPGGSITGAPKIRAMEMIRGIEKTARGVYCGAIGYSSPKGRSVFSIPIRTLEKATGRGAWRYGVGSGIVWDSGADTEWRECGNKCDFLAAQREEFRIFESLLFARGMMLYSSDHCSRMAGAAAYFGFPFSKSLWAGCLEAEAKMLCRLRGAFKVRVFLDRSGRIASDHEPLEPQMRGRRATILLSKQPIETSSPFLFHKTTIRPWYERSMRIIRTGACFDVIHTNERGELTEGARTNLFVRLKGVLYTPPIECGLLPGVLRRRMLASKKCRERILYPVELNRAEAVYCGNSVRGLVEVEVLFDRGTMHPCRR
jgi:para-aminobenzoate synthetase/4-amino-4-deoxychorismate lyase